MHRRPTDEATGDHVAFGSKPSGFNDLETNFGQAGAHLASGGETGQAGARSRQPGDFGQDRRPPGVGIAGRRESVEIPCVDNRLDGGQGRRRLAQQQRSGRPAPDPAKTDENRAPGPRPGGITRPPDRPEPVAAMNFGDGGGR